MLAPVQLAHKLTRLSKKAMSENSNSTMVRLFCVREGSKLRVKIGSAGYVPNANCQFPRGLRVDGREFWIPAEAVTLVNQTKKAFYRVSTSHAKAAVTKDGQGTPHVAAIYDVGDEDGMCSICLCEARTHVATPCGHFYACLSCATTSQQKRLACAICRGVTQAFVDRSLVE